MTTATKYKTYSKYKPSGIDWLGDIPAEWEVWKYGHLFMTSMGETILREDLVDDGKIPVYSATEENINFGYVDSASVILDKGDLVIPARGNSIGNVKLVDKLSTTTQTTIYSKLIKKNKTDIRYILYLLKGLKDVYFFFDRTAIPQITVNQVQNNDLCIPPIEDQKSIADFLDRETAKIDEMVAKKQKMIDLLKEKRQALITHAVTKGLDPKVKMKPSGIDWLGEIPEAWEAKRLRYFFDYHAGGFWGDEEKGDQNDLICFRVADFDFDHFGLSGDDLTTRNIPENQHSRILEKGDILLEKSGGGEKQTVGRAVRFDSNNRAVCSNFIEKLTPLKVHNSKYISYLMGALYFGTINVRSIKQTTGIQNLDIYAYFSEVVPFPEKEIQRTIADFLDRETAKIDEMMKKVEMQIEKLQEYRQALITSAVTGKIMAN